MPKAMKVTCSVGRASVRIDAPDEREFELVGGATDAVVRDIVDFATINGVKVTRVTGSEAEMMAERLAAAGLALEPAVEPAHAGGDATE